MPDERQRVYVAYGLCGCCIDMIADDRTDHMTVQAVNEWIFGHMRQGHTTRRAVLDEVVLDECPHGDAADAPRQQKMF